MTNHNKLPLPSTIRPSDLPVPVAVHALVASAAPADEGGRIWADRYEILRELYTGTFLAFDRVTRRELRLVTIAADQVSLVRQACQISAPDLLPIREVHQTVHTCFYTADVVEGKTLREELQHRLVTMQRFPVDEVRRMGESLVAALTEIQNQVVPTITPDTVFLKANGQIAISEQVLLATNRTDARDGQQQIAALLYELLTGTAPTGNCPSVDQVRSQVPAALAAAIQRALSPVAAKRFASLQAFRRALAHKVSVRSQHQSHWGAALAMIAAIGVGLGCWLARPALSKTTKAEFALRLGSVQELQKRAEQLEATLLADAKAAHDELDKWQREVINAREGNKPIQLEYATQRLVELRTAAETTIQIGELWQKHQLKTVWQSQANGELAAAQSLAVDSHFDGALEHLANVEQQALRLGAWQQAARQGLDSKFNLQAEINRREAALTDTPFAYAWPKQQLTTILQTLLTTDGQQVKNTVQEIQNSLVQIESLVALRKTVVEAEKQTVLFDELPDLRKQRGTILGRFKLADNQLKEGALTKCKLGYTQCADDLLQFTVNAVQQLTAMAQRSYDARDLEAALALLNQVVSITLESPEIINAQDTARILRAQVYQHKGDLAAALNDCNVVLTAQVHTVGALVCRASISNDAADYRGALADCNEALGIDPKSTAARMQRGIAGYCSGQPSTALADFEAVLATDARHAEALTYRGLINLDGNKLTAAAADFRTALELDASNWSAVAGQANVHRLQGDFTAAIQDCNVLLRLQPDSYDGYLTRGAAHLGLRALESAIRDLELARKINPTDTSAAVFLAQACNQLGDWKRSLAVCEAILQREAGNVGALSEIAAAYVSGGQTDAALAHLDRALTLDPLHASNLIARAELRFQTDNLAGAKQDYDQALAASPNHVTARIGRARFKIIDSDFTGAAEDCDVALRLDPQAFMAYRTRAVAHARLGRFQEVIADCTSALQLDANSAEVYACRASAYLQEQDYQKSIEDCDAALKLNPQMTDCYRTRSKAWFGQGEKDRAQMDYQLALRLEKKSQ